MQDKIIQYIIDSLFKTEDASTLAQRIGLLVSRSDNKDELVEQMVSGVPVSVERVNYSSLLEWMQKRFDYMHIDSTEGVELLNNGVRVVIKRYVTLWFKTQEEADSFVKTKQWPRSEHNYSERGEYTFNGTALLDGDEVITFSEAEEAGVVFEKI